LDKLDQENLIKLALVIGGAGASDRVSSELQKYVPQVSTEIAGAGTGLLLYLYGERAHRLAPALGIGLMAGSLLARVRQWVGGVAPPSGAPTGTGVPKTAASAAAQAYIAGKR